MTAVLERFTTEYIGMEDRLRLSVSTAGHSSMVIWLTQRLLQRLVPVLLQWLEQQGGVTSHALLLQEWAQQAARAELTAQPPVKAEDAASVWLAESIDITLTTKAVVLTFKGIYDQRATLTLAAAPLRQWLNIVYDAHVMAGWSMALWPEWLSAAASPAPAASVSLH